MNPVLVETVVTGAVLLGLTFAVLLLLRREAPATRHRVLKIAMVALVALPILAVTMPSIELAVLPVRPPPIPAGEDVVDTTPGLAARHAPARPLPLVLDPDPLPEDVSATVAPATTSATPMDPWTVAWGLGALLVLAPFTVSWLRARRIVAVGQAVREGVVRSPLARSPMAVGILNPTIVLPVASRGWPRQTLEQVLLHEQTHIKRLDVFWNALARLATAAHWFNPLAWLAARRLRAEAEAACDDAVLRSGVRASSYASVLVDVARRTRTPAAALSMADGPGLEQRVRRILGTTPRRPRRRFAILFAVGVALLFLVSSIHLTEQVAIADDDKPAGKPSPTLTVGPDARFETVQAAIDAAPAGARIVVAAGTFDGRVKISKPITIEGAGYERTILRQDDRENPGTPVPVISIHGARKVVLRGLKITWPVAPRTGGGVYAVGAVTAIDSDVLIDKCAIVGTRGSGVVGQHDAVVAIKDSLVANTGGVGIAVGGHEGGTGTLLVRDTDVRDPYHTCIRIGKGSSARIERCRISGAFFHGIRYDDASPIIKDNLIFRNTRSGIYASGTTAGTVSGNVFLEAGWSGIGCWFDNEDTIERNTFVRTSRGALEILGNAAPVIRKNVFFENKTGVVWMSSSSQKSTGKGSVTDNVFWKNGASVAQGASPTKRDPKADKNREANPGFADPASENFNLAEGSPLRPEGIGATNAPLLAGAFPKQDEETPQLVVGKGPRPPAGSSNERPLPTAQPKGPPPEAVAKPWVKAIGQLNDPAERDAALRIVRDALASDDPIQNAAAVHAILQTHQVNYDKNGLRELILPLVDRLEGWHLRAAFVTLKVLPGHEERDLDLLLQRLDEAGEDTVFRKNASYLIVLYSDRGFVRGAAAEAVLELLNGDRNDLRDVLAGLWGARVGRDIESRLLELYATDVGLKHDVIYYGLSTLQQKEERVVDVLIEAATELGSQSSGRALWGLRHGVAEDQQKKVADFAIKLLENRTDHASQDGATWLLRQYGTDAHLPALEAILQNDLASDQLKSAVKIAIRDIRSRG